MYAVQPSYGLVLGQSLRHLKHVNEDTQSLYSELNEYALDNQFFLSTYFDMYLVFLAKSHWHNL